MRVWTVSASTIFSKFVSSGTFDTWASASKRSGLLPSMRVSFESPYPFTCRRFQTDGRSIFAEAIDASGDPELLDLKRRQYVMRNVIQPSLVAGLEFENGRVRRWYPMERSKAVFLDPAIAFGKPVVADARVRTDILRDAWLAEGKNTRRVASLYEVSTKAVEAAVRFEMRLAA